MPIRLSLLVLLALLVPAVLAGPAAAQSKEKGGAGGTYVAIDTLTAMVMSGPGRRQVMTVQAGVDCPDLALRAYAEKVTPRLRDAYAQVLQFYASGLGPGAPPDADYVARRLQETTDRVLGKPGAKFLIGGIMLN
ncbi:MAG: hypothetical protein ACXU82_21235 [Caulobacteraceae bacterium]